MENASDTMHRTTPAGKSPRYRTSCDNCQTAKIKCGHEKPSCRRCSIQGLGCVYSLSRRMGRPRQKRTTEVTNRHDSRNRTQSAISHTRPRSQQATDISTSQTGTGIIGVSRDLPATDQSASNESSTGQVNQLTCPLNGSTTAIQSDTIVTNDYRNDHADSRPLTSPLDSSFHTQSHFESDDLCNAPEPLPPPNDTSEYTTIQATSSPKYSTGSHRGQSIDDNRLSSNVLDEGSNSLEERIDPRLRYISASEGNGHQESSADVQATDGNNIRPASDIDLLDQLLNVDSDVSTNTRSGPCDFSNSCTDSSNSRSKLPASVDLLARNEEIWSGAKEPANQRHACDCSSLISKNTEKVQLEQKKPNARSLDCALKIENELETVLTRFQRCTNGCGTDSIVNLVAFISVETTMKLLQEAACHELRPLPRKRLNCLQGAPAGSSHPQLQQGSAEDCNLYIGSHKLSPKLRLHLLRKLLQMRLLKLIGFVKNRGKVLSELKPDGTTRAATLLLQDILMGLHTITGWTELWKR